MSTNWIGRIGRGWKSGSAAASGVKSFLALVALLLLVLGCSEGSSELTRRQGAEGDLTPSGPETVWVLMKEQADLRPARSMRDWRQRGREVHDRLTKTSRTSQTGLLNRVRRLDSNAKIKPFWIVNSFQVTADKDTIAAIEADPAVAGVYPDRVLEVPPVKPGATTPTVDGVEWGIDAVRAPQAWAAFGARGEGIVIANIDTGVQFDHPALARQYRGNENGVLDHNYNWHDPSGICPGGAPCDNNNHGTHTMGTMVGDDGTPGGNQIGVAPGAKWIAAKGCEQSSCSLASLLSAGEWILAPTDLNGENPRPDLRPNIVNNSWGGGGADPWYRATVQAWVAAGIFPAFSNGNSGSSCGTSGSPGDYEESYSAGAFDASGQIASFSSRGAGLNGGIKPNIAAPGVDVRSSIPGGAYASYQGTSMASPHLAGVVALMWSSAPSLVGDIEQTRNLLDQTAVDTSDTTCGGTAENNNVWGEGKVDAFAAVELAPRGPVGTLTGRVTDLAGTGLAGATVAVTGATNRSVVTDASGDFSVGLPVGDYEVTGAAYGYFPATLVGQSISEGATTTVQLALEAAPSFLLSGTVSDGGQPVVGADLRLSGTPLTATTNSSGHYQFAAVPVGDYSLVVTPPGACVQGETRDVSVAQNRVEDFGLARRRDAFGYGCAVLPASYVDADTALVLSGDDSATVVTLPFDFPFYGSIYNTLFVSTNGHLNFGSTNTTYSNTSLPNSALPNSALYPYWDDLYIDASAGVWTETLGSAPNRTFVIEYRNVRFYSGTGQVDFEVLLREDGGIRFQYKLLDSEREQGLSATVGIENSSGTVAFQYSYNQPVLSSGLAIEFSVGPHDSEPPMVALTQPSDGAVLSGLASLSADASDNVGVARVEFYSDLGTASEVLIGTDVAAPFDVEWNTVRVSSGTHLLAARAFDLAGNFSQSGSVTVQVDNPVDTVPPTVSISSPGPGELLSAVVPIVVLASDDVAIDSVDLAIDGAVVDSRSSAPYQFSWNTTLEDDGVHEITALARDLAGNLTVSVAVSVTTDNGVPHVALTAPAPGALLSGTIALGADASDASGIAQVDFLVDGALHETDTTQPFTASWDSSLGVDGVHLITAVARDALGNSDEATVDIVTDNSAPLVTLSSPTAGEVVRGIVTLSANATDSTSGIAQVAFAVDGVVLWTDSSAPFSTLWDTTAVQPGAHVITVTATDAVGNVSGASAVDVTVAPSFQYSWFEAEQGSPLAPLRVSNDPTASGGQYIEASPGQNSTNAPPAQGRAVYTFDVVEGGTFKLWGRTIAPNNSDDSLWVRVDDGTWARWNFIQASTSWQWDAVHHENNGALTDLFYDLAEGTHSITVAYREDGTKLDRLLITDDLDFVPSGEGPRIPGVPAGLSASAGDGQVSLSWSSSVGATSYVVQRGNSGGPYTEIADGVSQLSYSDLGLTNGVEYCYVVAAVNEAGASENSAEICATPELACVSDGDCDDGLVCNGTESCVESECVSGAPVTCDDGVSCTADSCDEQAGGCVHAPSHAACSDGIFCNGAEICDPVSDCSAGFLPTCDDGIACTTEACDLVTDSCRFVPDDAACSDSLFCNGVEVCDLSVGCLDRSDPCPADSCDEAFDVCTAECAADSDCDDGVFCNGPEACSGGACQPGAPPDCDDGVACTTDSCDVLSDDCSSVAHDVLCDDGLFCNGAESCNAAGGCEAGGDPCAGASCDEENNACEAGCSSAADCDDGQYCNGQETCASGECQAGQDQGQACLSARSLARNQQSGAFGTTGEVWFVITDNPNGWQASEVQGRTIFVNGQQVTAGQMPLPPAINGQRYFRFTAGSRTWSSWSFW